MFLLFVNKYRIDWDDYLLYVMMVYCVVIYDSIKYLLNLLILGCEIEFLIDIIKGYLFNYEEDICINEYIEFVKEVMFFVF